MGSAVSLSSDIPERVDLETCQKLANHFGVKNIDFTRFDLIKDKDGTISRHEALQIAENKMPRIYSVNPCLVIGSTAAGKGERK
jgi:hypothetical protein